MIIHSHPRAVSPEESWVAFPGLLASESCVSELPLLAAAEIRSEEACLPLPTPVLHLKQKARLGFTREEPRCGPDCGGQSGTASRAGKDFISGTSAIITDFHSPELSL